MASSPAQMCMSWTADVIITCVYRVVMILASIALVWQKYRRPRRLIDEERSVKSKDNSKVSDMDVFEDQDGNSQIGDSHGKAGFRQDIVIEVVKRAADRVKYEPVHDEESTPGEHDRFETVHLECAAIRKPAPGWRRHLRLILELGMVAIIVLLLVRSPPGVMKGETLPVPKFPKRQYLFLEDKRYVHDDMFNSEHETLTTLHNWIELSSVGRGFVSIPNADSFNLGDPYVQNPTHRNDSVPVFMMSAFHQLHCLSYLAEYYVTAKDKEVQHHSAHCFDFLRQSIQCGADSNLEGKTDTGPGWGSVHNCADWDAVLAWANERTASRWKGNLPGESTL